MSSLSDLVLKTWCSLIYKEVIEHYLTNGSNMYICLLDPTKVFDLLNLGNLFKQIIDECSLVSFVSDAVKKKNHIHCVVCY